MQPTRSQKIRLLPTVIFLGVCATVARGDGLSPMPLEKVLPRTEVIVLAEISSNDVTIVEDKSETGRASVVYTCRIKATVLEEVKASAPKELDLNFTFTVVKGVWLAWTGSGLEQQMKTEGKYVLLLKSQGDTLQLLRAEKETELDTIRRLMTQVDEESANKELKTTQDGGTAAGEPNVDPYQVTIERIAEAIERLKADYPQLADYSPRHHCDRTKLVIEYDHNTHRAPRRGGWTSGVPNPDKDGIWFYIDFHDPASQREIHTQPVVPRYRYGDRLVMFLILEGKQTRRTRSAILQILRDNRVEVDDGEQ